MKRERRYIYVPPEEVTEVDENHEVKEELDERYTYSLHKDNKQTLVKIDDKLYSLTLSNLTMKDIKGMKFKDTPHIRLLNPIPNRTPEGQELHNDEAYEIHKLSKKVHKRNTEVTSLRKAMALGANVPEVIEKLMAEKEAANKAGDVDKAKKIRKQLRNLDYKRYLEEKK